MLVWGSGLSELLGVLAVFVLVAANGFFVTAEFSLVAIRRSRVAELVATGKRNAQILDKAIHHLDENLAATQLGITISSLALGWIGEPALAHLIEPLLRGIPQELAKAESHGIAVGIAFVLITAVHIVLGELAPKSLALQRSERAALWVVRPLRMFLFLFRPAIRLLNGLGNFVLHSFGLESNAEEKVLHSPAELKLLVQASHEAGILHQEQQEVVVRVLDIGERKIADIMTPRTEVAWIDVLESLDQMVQRLRECPHEQILVGRASIDEPLGVVSKRDILHQLLEGKQLNPLVIMHQPLLIYESTPIFKVLEHFKRAPVQLGIIVNEYGSLEGIVTQTDLLEAIAGNLPELEGEDPDVVEREDGSLLLNGMMQVQEAFNRLGIKTRPDAGFHTIAGFVLMKLAHMPKIAESFVHEGWRFEIVDLDGLRIDKLLVRREP